MALATMAVLERRRVIRRIWLALMAAESRCGDVSFFGVAEAGAGGVVGGTGAVREAVGKEERGRKQEKKKFHVGSDNGSPERFTGRQEANAPAGRDPAPNVQCRIMGCRQKRTLATFVY